MQITFTHPWYLLFLLSIPVLIFLHLYMARFVRKQAFKFANFEVIKRVGIGIHGGHILTRNLPPFSIRMVAVFFLILSLSGMVFWYSGVGEENDYVVAIDSSGSMLAKDFDPNRLDAAKTAALEFVSSLSKKTRVAIVTFAGTTFVKKDMSADKELAELAVSEITLSPSGGTAIGDAIINSINLFDDDEKSKIIILLTDGQNTVGTDVDAAVEYANTNFVTIHTIGMATTAGGEFSGLKAVSKLDEETMKNIADKTGGNFYKAENSRELVGVYNQISMFSLRNIPVPLTVQFIIVSIGLIIVEWLLAAMRYRIIP